MREKRTFAERTKVLKSDEVKKKYFLVFEDSRKYRAGTGKIFIYRA